MPARALAASCAVLLCLGGCRADSLQGAQGSVRLVEDGAYRDAARLDFGDVYRGQVAHAFARVANPGRAPVTLQVPAVEAPFALTLAAPLLLPAGGEAELDFSFSPALVPSPKNLEAFAASLTLTAEGAPETLSLALAGRALGGACELPETLDFGKVVLGSAGQAALAVRNPSPASTTADFGAITSSTAQAAFFRYAPGSPQGSGQVPPQGMLSAQLEFTPLALGAYSAQVEVQPAPECPPRAVRLQGEGVSEVLAWTPEGLEFGYVALGSTATATITFDNAAARPVALQFNAPVQGDFQVSPAQLSVPARGTAQVTVSFSPTQLGPRGGAFRFQTDTLAQPQGAFTARGDGGGPRILVRPLALGLGRIPFVAGAVGPALERRVTVLNAGTAAAQPSGNLQLGQRDAAGGFTGPALELTMLQGPAGALRAALAPTPPEGLAQGKFLDITVSALPTAPGPLEAELRIFSNDPSQSVTTVRVTGEALEVPPCSLVAQPVVLDFGVVGAPQRRALSTRVRNLSASPCELSGLDLEGGSAPEFSLVQGPVASRVLAPGEELEVQVAVTPTALPPAGLAQRTGALQFFVPSPTQPKVTVPLRAQVIASCLVLGPDAIDFGTVAVGCRSALRSLSVYNLCPAAAQLTSLALDTSAECPGPSCPFVLEAPPALPATVPPGGAAVQVGVRFVPQALGARTAALAVQTPQGRYAAPLKGLGASTGLNVETTVLPPAPATDLLLVVDNSCSMAQYQASLAQNFPQLFSAALASGTDFHFAVTTTDVDQGERGALLGDPVNPRVLSKATPNLQALFTQKVTVGTSGTPYEMGLAAAARALSEPLLSTTNAGFLRSQARLVVLFVTDAPDQSVGPAAGYFAVLKAVKGAQRAEFFTAHGLVGLNRRGTPGYFNCRYDGPPDDGVPFATRRYSQLIADTGGVREDICVRDWAPITRALSAAAFGPQLTYPLAAAPESQATITVELGLPFASVAPTSGANTVWSYDAATQSLRFNPAYTPAAGQTVRITYQVACQ